MCLCLSPSHGVSCPLTESGVRRVAQPWGKPREPSTVRMVPAVSEDTPPPRLFWTVWDGLRPLAAPGRAERCAPSFARSPTGICSRERAASRSSALARRATAVETVSTLTSRTRARRRATTLQARAEHPPASRWFAPSSRGRWSCSCGAPSIGRAVTVDSPNPAPPARRLGHDRRVGHAR